MSQTQTKDTYWEVGMQEARGRVAELSREIDNELNIPQFVLEKSLGFELGKNIDALNLRTLPVFEKISKDKMRYLNLNWQDCYRSLDWNTKTDPLSECFDEVTTLLAFTPENFAFYCLFELLARAATIHALHKTISAAYNEAVDELSVELEKKAKKWKKSERPEKFKAALDNALPELRKKILQRCPNVPENLLNPDFQPRYNPNTGSIEKITGNDYRHTLDEGGDKRLISIHKYPFCDIAEKFTKKQGHPLPSQPVLDKVVEAVAALLPALFTYDDSFCSLHSNQSKAIQILKDSRAERNRTFMTMPAKPFYTRKLYENKNNDFIPFKRGGMSYNEPISAVYAKKGGTAAEQKKRQNMFKYNMILLTLISIVTAAVGNFAWMPLLLLNCIVLFVKLWFFDKKEASQALMFTILYSVAVSTVCSIFTIITQLA